MSVRFWRLLVVLVVTVTAVPAAAGTISSADPQPVDRAADRIGREVTAPGAAWVVSTPERTVAGATGSGIDADTDFLWGSVAKPVAGLVAAGLVCEGDLDLGTPALELLPTRRPPADDGWEQVTVGMLLDQSSGAPPLLDQLDDEEPGRSQVAAVDRVLAEPLVAEPGTGHHYSSANYLLLQVVLERAAGRPYAVQVADLLDARGVDDPVVSREDAHSRVTPGHRLVLGQPVSDGVRFDDLGLAYGYLGGSARDLAAVGRSVVDDLGRNGCTAGAVATRPRQDLGDDAGYGLGWQVGGLGTADQVLWHAGALPGHTVVLAVVPEHDTVVVLLQDVYSQMHNATLTAPALDAVRELAGGTPVGSGVPTGYWAILGVLTAVAAVLAVAAVRLGRRPGKLARSAAWAAVGGLVVAASLLLPRLVGVGDLATLYRWQPDIGVLTVLCGLGGLLVMGVAVRGAIRRLRT